MKPPKKIKINGYEYSCDLVPDAKGIDGKSVYGSVNYFTQKIIIEQTASLDRQKESVLHELLHVIWDHADLPSKQEEHTIRVLAKGLHALLKDNKKLIDYLA